MVPFVVLLAAAAGWAIWSGGMLDSVQSPSGRHLQDMPEFSLSDASGKKRSSDEIRGKVAMVHFWASWCAPCLEEIPKWTAFAGAYSGNDAVRFVAISLDQKWEDALKVLPKDRLPPGSLSLLDADQKVSEAFGSFQFPETYLVSRSGKVVMKWVGPQNWDSPRIKEAIEMAVRSVR